MQTETEPGPYLNEMTMSCLCGPLQYLQILVRAQGLENSPNSFETYRGAEAQSRKARFRLRGPPQYLQTPVRAQGLANPPSSFVIYRGAETQSRNDIVSPMRAAAVSPVLHTISDTREASQ